MTMAKTTGQSGGAGGEKVLAPQIDAIAPAAALPLGEVELTGANLARMERGRRKFWSTECRRGF